MNISPVGVYSSNFNRSGAFQKTIGFQKADEKKLIEMQKKTAKQFERAQRLYEEQKRSEIHYIYDDELIKRLVCNPDGKIDYDKLSCVARVSSKLDNIIESDLSQKTARKYHNVIADLKSEIIESLVEENRIYGNGNYKPDKVEQDLDNWIEYLNSSYKYLNENLEIMPLHLSIEDSKAPDDNLAIIENSFIYKLCLLVRYNKPRLTYTIINKD